MKNSRPHDGRRRATFDGLPSSMLMVMFFFMVVSQIVTITNQAAMTTTVDVVRVIRVDVPPVVRSYDVKPEPGEAPQPPLLLGCTYALQGGENDDENGADVFLNSRSRINATLLADHGKPAPELAMDAATEEVQRKRGLVVKWYFRRNPVPVEADDPLSIIDDSQQVYQWMAGGGPEAGGPLGPLVGRAVDVSAETPRLDKSVLHRVIRVERPTAELTGEYRCQVEDWNAERRSIWHPMVVYMPERIFKMTVDDNDDDDADDISEGSDGDLSSSTSQAPTTSTTAAAPPNALNNNSPTEINITCYAAGVQPEPSMSIWVNGVMQESVTTVVTEDDGDDDDDNDGPAITTTTTTTTARPKIVYRNRYRSHRDDPNMFRKYAIRAEKVVSLKDAEEYRANQTENHRQQRRRRYTVEVECRLRVPGDGVGDGYWKADRPADTYYGSRKLVSYKYRADPPQQPSDAFAAMSSGPSTGPNGGGGDDDDDDDDDDNVDDAAAAQEAPNNGAAYHATAFLFVQSAIVALVAARPLQ